MNNDEGDLKIRQMTSEEALTYLDAARRVNARHAAESGVSFEVALYEAQKEDEELLPDGPETPGNHFVLTETATGDPAGWMWYCDVNPYGSDGAWIMDITVAEGWRRKGIAATLASHAETQVDVSTIGMCVFTGSAGAVAIARRLGYSSANVADLIDAHRLLAQDRPGAKFLHVYKSLHAVG